VDGGTRGSVDTGMLDRPIVQRSNKIKTLHWQTCAPGHFDPQRLFRTLANQQRL
jgi:hypothetical protein